MIFDNQRLLIAPAIMVATLTGLPGSQSVNLNLGTPGQSTGITQFRSSSTATAVAQNGRGAVVLPSAGVDNAGVVQPLFNNGKTIPLAQLAVTGFNDAKGPVARRNQSLQRFGRPWKNAWRIIGRIKRKRRNRVLSPDHRPTRVRANARTALRPTRVASWVTHGFPNAKRACQMAP